MPKRKSKEPLSSENRAHIDAFEGEEADRIEIDFSLIPDHVRDKLTAATLEAVRKYIRQPGGREKLAAITAAREARQKT